MESIAEERFAYDHVAFVIQLKGTRIEQAALDSIANYWDINFGIGG